MLADGFQTFSGNFFQQLSEQKSTQMTEQQHPTKHSSQPDLQSRTPKGIEPEFIWKEKRLYALVQAVSRYIDSRTVEPKAEWFSEIHNLIGDLQANTSRFDNYNNWRTTDD